MESNKTFRKINPKTGILLDIDNVDYFSNNEAQFDAFYEMVNKHSIRRFTYILIKPLLEPNYFFVKETKETKLSNSINYNEIKLLKKYLRKFKYHYRRRFFYQNGNYKNLPTGNKLNRIAIKALFLLMGI